MTPIEQMMSRVDWKKFDLQQTDGDMPYATHSGILEIAGMDLRVYRLNDGRAIIDADDMIKFFDKANQ